MPRGENLHPLFRSSWKRYRSRPPANCRSAREAWDHLSKADVEIVCLWLGEGYWSAEYSDGEFADTENTFGANRYLATLAKQEPQP